MNNRTQSLLSLLKRSSLQAIALNPGPTLTYLTGLQFHLMERPTVLILTREGKAALILPLLESAKVGKELEFLKCFSYGDNPATWIRSFHEAMQYLGLSIGDLGVESNRLRFLEMEYLNTSLPGCKLVNASDVISSLRIQKDAGEIEAMRKAAQIAQQALKATPTDHTDRSDRT